jgi:hypothetical protein
LLIAVVLAAPAAVPADLSDEEVLRRAEASFHEGLGARSRPDKAQSHFGAAADDYHALHERGIRNAELYRNEGQAALLAGRLPQAILAFRRGLRLASQDTSLQENLEYARDQVSYPPGTNTRPAVPSWPAWLPWLTPLTHVTLAAAAYVLAWVAATRWLMTRRAATAAVAGLAIGATAALGAWWALRQAEQADAARYPLVVVAVEHAALHTGNGSSYPAHEALPVLSRGMEARQRFARGEWLQVEVAGGATGWVRRADVLLDAP